MGQGQSSSPAATASRTSQKADAVVIPVDGSAQAEKAFDYYVQHMHKPENQVIVLHCFEPPRPPPSYYQRPRLIDPAKEWEERIEKHHKEVNLMIEKFKKKVEDNMISGSVQTETVRSKAGETIVEALNKHNADYCVMGTRGLGLLRQAFLGSVSNYVIHNANIPITVVPAETAHWLF